MKRNVGIWIDHREAFIVSLSDNTNETMRITSHMEKHVRFSGGAENSGGDDQRDKRFTGHLNKYYDKVVSSIRDADAIFIIGPGEAREELKARLEGEALGKRIAGIEAADKMTDGQITARVKEWFLHPAKVVEQVT
jgi:hypothetical protein